MNSPSTITALLLLLLLCVSSVLYYPQYASQKAMTAELGALLTSDSHTDPLGARTKSSNCVVQNASPDPTCTPGRIFGAATLNQICVHGYTKTVRNVSTKLRQSVFAEYGIAYPSPRGSYEVDHLIPLALGGDNDIANLFPQPAEPAPGFREKDLVEVYLYEEACALRVDLAVAQARIAADWLLIYNNLPQDEIQRLKSKYRNWSN